MANLQKVFNVIRPRIPLFQLVLKHVSFEGEGHDEQNRPPLSVTLHLGKRSLESLRLESGSSQNKVRFRKFFRTGKGLKWIKVVAHWADGSETVVSRFLIFNIAKRPPNPFARDYHHFIERNGPKEQDFQILKDTVGRLSVRPKFSVILPTYNTDPKWLRAAVGSVMDQIYPDWELCIADDASTRRSTLRTLRKLEVMDSRIRVCYRKQNGHISKASNSALDMATGDWISLLDHDDLLLPHSLARVALEINRFPEARFIYSDEDKVDTKGIPVAPYFKPDWNLLFLRSQNYICHLSSIRREDIEVVGRFREGYEGSQDWDLFLRLGEYLPENAIRHIPEVLYHWRVIPGSVAANIGEKTYSVDASRKALEEGIPWSKEGSWNLVAGMYWVCEPPPIFEETIQTIKISIHSDGFILSEDPGDRDVLVFMPRGAVYECSDLERLSAWTNLPNIGIVAGSLFGSGRIILESGLLLESDGGLVPIFSNLPFEFEGMGRRETIPQNVSVPGRWFFAVRKKLWDQFATERSVYKSWSFRVAATALGIKKAGLDNVLDPRIGVFSEVPKESVVSQDKELLVSKWPGIGRGDPGSNINLTTQHGFFSIDVDRRVGLDWEAPRG